MFSSITWVSTYRARALDSKCGGRRFCAEQIKWVKFKKIVKIVHKFHLSTFRRVQTRLNERIMRIRGF